MALEYPLRRESGRATDSEKIPRPFPDIDANVPLDGRLSSDGDSPRALPESLAGLLRSFARHVGDAGGRIRIDGLGVLAWQAGAGEPEARWRDAAAPVEWTIGTERRACTRAHEGQPWQSLPISYASRELGELRLPWLDATAWEQCAAFARRCGRLVKQHEILRWSSERLGRPLQLAGDSEPLRRLESFVEIAATNELPVLLSGEFGTEKTLVAVAIHCGGPRPDAPFVEVIGAYPEGPPSRWFKQARGGTLFFNGIDELPLGLQTALSRHLNSRLDQWLNTPSGVVRLIASTTTDLGAGVAGGRFSRSLLAELNFLSVTIPPLRERMSDLEPLVACVLARCGHARDPERTRALAAICRHHEWPENLFELERIVARLAALTAGRSVTQEELSRHVPWQVAESTEEAAGVEVDHSMKLAPAQCDVPGDSSAPSLQQWVDRALALDPARLSDLHPCLRKALLHLGRHFAEPMSLDELAASAHVSPSHLGFLLRSVAGTSFKPLLQAIRLERAKVMLRADPHLRITEAALSVGFMDLSHFQKSFRRFVGLTPRQFRAGA